MEALRKPEILEADLAPLLLQVAAWGEADALRLPWLTPPPAQALKTAQALLLALGAIDPSGRLTAHGRDMASLPCHPRVAQLLLAAEDDVQKAIAADIAALLEEKDPMAMDEDPDISLYWRITRLFVSLSWDSSQSLPGWAISNTDTRAGRN